jgi:hypothetical protein
MGTGIQADTTTTIASVSPNPALVGQTVTVNSSVAPPTGDTLAPSGTVTVKASTGESCTSAAPSGSCPLMFSTAATRTIAASYGGDSNFTSSTSSSVSEQIVDFDLSASPGSETISAGHDASYTLTVSSKNGFSGVVSLTCSGGPVHSPCIVSPTSISVSGTSAANSTATLSQPQDHGTYILTFAASYGGVTHTATGTLTVKGPGK